MAFPSTRLAHRLEFAYGSAPDATPGSRIWSDVSDYLLRQTINFTRGQADGAATSQPSQFRFELDNTDSLFTPGTSPNVRRGLPVRYWTESPTIGLVLPADGAYLSTPDHADFDFGENLDIRIRLTPESWSDPNDRVLLAKWESAGNQRQFEYSLDREARPELKISDDGSATLFDGGDPLPRTVELRPVWLGILYDADNGSGSRDVYYYRSNEETPPANVQEWTLDGYRSASGTATMFNSSAALEVGASAGGGIRGVIHKLEIRPVPNFDPIVDIDFSTLTEGTSSFTDSDGHVWTLGGEARLTNERIRFTGEIASVTPYWPYGDNHRAATTATEARTQFVAADLTRRITRGQKPALSPLRRHVTTIHRASLIHDYAALGLLFGYWPCEDNGGADSFANGLTANLVLTGAARDSATIVSGIETGSDSSLFGSEALPTVKSGQTGEWSVAVPTSAPAYDPGQFVIEFFFKLGDTATETQLFEFTTLGTGRTWQLSFSSTQMRMRVLDSGDSEIENQTWNRATDEVWNHCRITGSGSSTTSYTIDLLEVTEQARVQRSGSFSGGYGQVDSIGATIAATSDVSFGHFVTHDGFYGDEWLDMAAIGWPGESANRRLFRICTEEDITFDAVGDPELAAPVGDVTLSEPMGPQPIATVSALLNDCVNADDGILLANRRAPGYVYRSRLSLEGQTPALELDANDQILTQPFEPKLDDERITNDATVKSSNGSSARVVDTDHQGEEGTYDVEETRNLAGGIEIPSALLTADLITARATQLERAAARRVYAGTWPGMRYPSVAIDLGNAPEYIDRWHNLEAGDIITVTNLPEQHPAGAVELQVEHVSESVSPTTWTAETACVPGGPSVTPLTFDDPIVLVAENELPFAVPNDFRTSWSIPVPAVLAGDFITISVAQQESTDPGRPSADPSGYTRRSSLPSVFSSQVPQVTKVYKRATAAAGASTATFTFPNPTRLYGIVKVWRNVDQSNPWAVSAPADSSGQADPDPAAISTLVDGAVIELDIAGNKEPQEASTIPAGYTAGPTNLPAIKGFVTSYKTVDTAGPEDPGATTWAVDNHTAITDALRPSGGGATLNAPATAAVIPDNELLVSIAAERPATTWGKNRPSGAGQVIEAGNRFIEGQDDDLQLSAGHGLTFDDTDTLIESFAMEDGETARLRFNVRDGVPVIRSSTQFVSGGSGGTYSYQTGVHNTTINIPPCDPLAWDGTRGQQASIGKPVKIGPTGDTFITGQSFVVMPWMRGDDYTSGPMELHTPATSGTSPLLSQIRDGKLKIFSRSPKTDVVVNGDNPGAGLELYSQDLPADFSFFGYILRGKVDPNGTGFLDVWECDAQGNYELKASIGNQWGWMYDEGHAGYTDENENFYFIHRQHYTFHSTDELATDNWDEAGRGSNVQTLETPRAVASLSSTVTPERVAGDIRYHTDPDARYELVYQTDWTDPGDLTNGDWLIYGDQDGWPGNAGWGRRHPDAVSMTTATGEGNVLQIEAFMGTTGPETGLLVHGGAKLSESYTDSSHAFQYGRIRFRARVDLDPDEVTSGLGLLWPDTDIVGAELNIMENYDHRDTRSPIQHFLHWGNGQPQRGRETTGKTTADWHDYECIWSEEMVSVSVDGETPVVLGTAAGEVPSELMVLIFQLDAWADPAISNADPNNPAHQPVLSAPLVMQVSSCSVERRV